MAGNTEQWCDSRACAPVETIVYRGLHHFRKEQMALGVLSKTLTDVQWGLVTLDRCHHISITASCKDGPQSFRVRICKTCCHENCHIELGTYADQESAILVNDAFEIMSKRFDKLLVLRPEDGQFLHMLVAKKVDRAKGKENACVLELIAERSQSSISALEPRKRKSPGTSSDESASARKARTSISSPAPFDSPPYDEEVSDGDITTKSHSSYSHASKPSVLFHETIVSTNPLSSPAASVSYARVRSFTFSTAADYSPNNRFNSFYAQLNQNKTPIDTLTWLATMEDEEVDVAKSLFALKSVRSDNTIADDNLGAGVAAIKDMKQEEDCVAEKLLLLSSSRKQVCIDNSTAGTPGTGMTNTETEENDCDDPDYDNDDGDRGYDYHSDPEEYHADHIHALMTTTGSNVHAINQNIIANNMRGRRGRANSMSVLERPILGVLPLTLQLNCPPGSPSNRSKDPLTMVLKKFADRGAVPGKGYVGIYSPEDRKARIERFLEKRKNRMWTKKVKYDVRKNFADSRIRVKGRFVKKDEEQAAIVMAFTDKAHKSVHGRSSSHASNIYIPKSASKAIMDAN